MAGTCLSLSPLTPAAEVAREQVRAAPPSDAAVRARAKAGAILDVGVGGDSRAGLAASFKVKAA
ncbi:hypothetical protein LJR225_001989 [Phenylobacterium sp. LjRoot225]|uniref:hypothetical protein n=1 Tax=Phenylobacterium sp. LjRoot225 TaxID=3342285 RepID=UPI003ECED8DE